MIDKKEFLKCIKYLTNLTYEEFEPYLDAVLKNTDMIKTLTFVQVVNASIPLIVLGIEQIFNDNFFDEFEEQISYLLENVPYKE